MAGWTDYLPDWSSKDKLRLCSTYDALNALTAAVNERTSVTNYVYNYLLPYPVNRVYPVRYYAALIDAAIKRILPLFANHTVNDGDYTGLDAVPMWTWNNILGGEPDANVYSNPIIDYVWQRYRIINKLRWQKNLVRFKGSPSQARKGGRDWTSSEDGSVSWITVQDELKQMEWGGLNVSPFPEFFDPYYTASYNYYSGDTGHSLSASRVRSWIEFHNRAPFDSLINSRDYYVVFDYEGNQFVNYDYPIAVENKLYRVYNDISINNSDNLYVGNFDNIDQYPSLDTRPSEYGWHIKLFTSGSSTFPVCCIHKYTDQNGFTFKDW